MKSPTDPGMNRTGLQMSPFDTQPLIDAAQKARPTSDGDEQTLFDFRQSYLEEADSLGAVPIPGTAKGALKVLADKLGERLAFERTGTRLYEAFLGKCQIRPEEAADLPLDRLRHFHDEEAQHFAMLCQAMEELGLDPTAQTPCADADAVASMGLIQVIGDPRTSVGQSLHAIHIAELADGDGWRMLIQLTREMGLDDLADRFQQASTQEEEHLETVRALMAKLTLSEAVAGAA